MKSFNWLPNKRMLRVGALLVAASVTALSAAAIPVQSFHKNADGVTLTMSPGTMRLTVCSDSIVRVMYSPNAVLPAGQDFVVTNHSWRSTSFKVADVEGKVMLTTRKLVQKALHEVEMSLRGVLRGFGLKVGKVAPAQFEARIRELVEGHPNLETIATSMLAVRATLRRELNGFEKRLRALARSDTRARLLMSTPGVGTIVALTYAAAIDDPARFKSSKTVGAHFGLTPTKYQSGETDRDGRISKIGDGSVRAALYESAHIILTKPVKGCADLKSWAMRIAKRAGMKKAKVALARKLAVIMHRMLADGTTFTTQPA